MTTDVLVYSIERSGLTLDGLNRVMDDLVIAEDCVTALDLLAGHVASRSVGNTDPVEASEIYRRLTGIVSGFGGSLRKGNPIKPLYQEWAAVGDTQTLQTWFDVEQQLLTVAYPS